MNEYRTHVFDCDGVLLDSNGAKSQAFYEAALPYGEDAARRMVAFHKGAGSMSRRDRWVWFFERILEREPEDGELDAVMRECTRHVLNGVRTSPKLQGVEEYLRSLRGQRTVVVSGVETEELRLLMREHGLADHFDGIHGGPRRKREVLKRLVGSGEIELPALYYGDTKDDYESAREADLDFMMVTGASEWDDWRETLHSEPGVYVIRDFRDIEGSDEGRGMRDEPHVAEGTPPSLPIGASRNGKFWVGREGYAVVGGDRVYVGRSLAGSWVRLPEEVG